MSPQGFDEFYTRTFTKVLSVATMASGSRFEAEDAVQEGYLAAFRRWDLVGGYERPEAWVLKVALRQLVRSRHRHRRQDQPLELTVPPQATPDETAYAREVLGALASLPADVRIAMVTCAVFGWTQEEFAEALDVSRNTIANRIFRGRVILRMKFGLVGQLPGGRDALVPAPQLAAHFAVPDDDPVDAMLVRAERWLRAGLEAEPETAERIAEWIREQVAPQATAAPGRPWRRPWGAIGRWTAGRTRGGQHHG
jgi:RNA polymerase sigma-70 factor (ECF subfamily)